METTERVLCAASILEEWSAFTADQRDEARTALGVLEDDPIAGAPLLDPLRGLWAYRSESLRFVYRIEADSGRVLILSITRVR